MTKAFSLFLLCALLLCPVAAKAQSSSLQEMSAQTPRIGSVATQTRFAQSIEDLPVMDGLEVIEENDVLFVLGSDRIAQTTLKGRVDIDNVYYFYMQSLPQLGWKKINPKTYERNGERLRMEPSSANAEGMTYVRFEVSPLKKAH